MIFALREPTILAGLVVGFLAGVPLRVLAQRAVVRGGRAGGHLRAAAGRGFSGHAGRFSGRLTFGRGGGWSAYLDPYGTVAAVLAGPGWGRRPEPLRRRPGTDVALLVTAVGVHAALAAAGCAAFTAAGGDLGVFRLLNLSSILHGSVGLTSTAQALSIGFGAVNLGCAVLALMPIPPLELGIVLWSRLPRTPGARRMAFHLLEEQWGVAVVLLLLLLPLAGQQPLLLALIDLVAGAVLPHF